MIICIIIFWTLFLIVWTELSIWLPHPAFWFWGQKRFQQPTMQNGQKATRNPVKYATYYRQTELRPTKLMWITISINDDKSSATLSLDYVAINNDIVVFSVAA